MNLRTSLDYWVIATLDTVRVVCVVWSKKIVKLEDEKGKSTVRTGYIYCYQMI